MPTPYGLALAAALVMVGAPSAQAYDFKIVNETAGQTIFHGTVASDSSALCPDVTFQSVDGLKLQDSVTLAMPTGCLITRIDLFTRLYTDPWNGARAGGTFKVLPARIYATSYICADDDLCHVPD